MCDISGCQEDEHDKNSITRVTGGIYRRDMDRIDHCTRKSYLEIAMTHETVQDVNAIEL